MLTQLSCPSIQEPLQRYRPGPGPSRQELPAHPTLHTARQRFLTGSSLRFPQQSPRCLDPCKNLIAPQQRNYRPELVPVERFPELLPRQSVHPDSLGSSSRVISTCRVSECPHLGHASPGPLLCKVSALHGPLPGALPTQISALTAAAHRAPCPECAPQQRSIHGDWRPFTSLPRDLTKTSCASAFIQHCAGASGARLCEGLEATFSLKVSFPENQTRKITILKDKKNGFDGFDLETKGKEWEKTVNTNPQHPHSTAF